jgi:predicted dehydrogenase
MNIGIIGCGLIGTKRADSIASLKGHTIKMVASSTLDDAKVLGEKYNCLYTQDWKKVVNDRDIDIVIVSTTNDWLTPISIEAIKNSKHVIVEKPVARNPAELQNLIDVACKSNVKVKVGFNHRFHPAIKKARELIKEGVIGELMFVRARYGHGGRKGYESEWRSIPEIVGGGEVLDQGIHIIDLSRVFLGEFSQVIGFVDTFFWDRKPEDNGFMIMRTPTGKIAQLSASCTQWKNLFSFEIFGKTGQINIDGLGRSYGVETLTLYKMKPEMGIPDKSVYEFPGEDESWRLEFEDLVNSIEHGTPLDGDLKDSVESMKIVFSLYEWSKNFIDNKSAN